MRKTPILHNGISTENDGFRFIKIIVIRWIDIMGRDQAPPPKKKALSSWEWTAISPGPCRTKTRLSKLSEQIRTHQLNQGGDFPILLTFERLSSRKKKEWWILISVRNYWCYRRKLIIEVPRNVSFCLFKFYCDNLIISLYIYYLSQKITIFSFE